MERNYKITSTVNKQAYLVVRGKLMLLGKSFSEWLNEKLISEPIEGLITSKPALNIPVKEMSPKEQKRALHDRERSSGEISSLKSPNRKYRRDIKKIKN